MNKQIAIEILQAEMRQAFKNQNAWEVYELLRAIRELKIDVQRQTK